MDFYVILGLQSGATTTDIKRAYRRLARRYHPDINPGDRAAEALFRRIAEAYETLIDPDRRRQYDQSGGRLATTADSSFSFEGFDFTVAADGAHASTFGDLFADVFRRSAGAVDAPEPGADLHASVGLGFEEAVRGGERQLTLTRQITCDACNGAGVIRTPEGRCLHCRGAGSVRWARGHMVFSKACAACGGSGRQRHQPCASCNAQGVTARSETLTARIPAGVADGARVRVAGKGHAGRRGGAAGDLVVSVEVATHPLFERHGDDLHLVVPVAVHEAALGARIDVPAIDGTAKLRIPPGTQTGQRFRVRGRGVPSAQAGRPGDLVVEVRLVLPAVIDERSKELLREFGRIHSDDLRKDLRLS
jgi:molecular chaperone DnaJ